MGRPSVAVNAAVLAASIGIDAVGESDVRAIVVGDDRLRCIAEELRGRPRTLVGFEGVERVAIQFKGDRVKAIRGVQAGAAALDRK